MKYSLTDRLKGIIAMLERDHGLVAMAVWEAGSRSWGYSTDRSDYDIRFVYIKKPWMGTVTNTDDTFRQDLEFPNECGLRFELQGFDFRKFMGMLVRSDAFIHEILAGGSILAHGDCIDHISATAAAYIDLRAMADAYFSQMHRNLEPKRENKLTAKGIIHALRYGLMVEHMLNTHEIKPRLIERNDMENYSEFGSAGSVQAVIQHLRLNAWRSADELARDILVRKVFVFYEHMQRRMQCDLNRVPGGRNRDYTQADISFQRVLARYYHNNLNVPLHWVEGVQFPSIVRSI